MGLQSGRRPLKVLLVSPLPPPYGGISHWTRMVADHAENRSDLCLRVVDTSPSQRRHHLVNSMWRRSLEGIGRLLRESLLVTRHLTTWRPDAVHLNTSGHLAFVRDILVLSLARVLRVTAVYHLRFGRLPEAADSASWEWRLGKVALRLASTVVVLDTGTERVVRSVIDDERVRRLPNPLAPFGVGLSPHGLTRDKTVLFVGWVIPTKGIEELLEAWARIGRSDWELVIVGPGDPDYLDSLARRGLLNGVDVAGPLTNTEVHARMWRSEIFAFPSHTEGFPNAVAEAMATGMAIVASDVGAIATMLTEGAGRVVPPRAPAALRVALAGLMESPEERRVLGARAQERASAEYAFDSVFETYVELWRRGSVRS